MKQLLAIAAAVEGLSEHPLAHAIVVAAEQRGLTVQAAADFTSTTKEFVAGIAA